MASYNDRDSERLYEEWHRYGKDRGFFDRVSDEVKSWFGDPDAERRRQMDQQMRSDYGRSEYGGRSIDNEQPEWQRRDYSGPSPRGSRPEEQGRYDECGPSRRSMGQRQQGSWAGSEYAGRPQDREMYGPRPYGGGRSGMPRSQEFGARSARFFDDSRDAEPGMSWPSTRDYQRSGWPTMGPAEYGSSIERPGMYSAPGSSQVGGIHRGRGPRNYLRSDERISDEIHQLLTFHPDIDATDVDISVVTGVVTLKGAVDSRGAKRLAEDLVEDVFGVKEVHNELRVNRGDFNKIGQQTTVDNESTKRDRMTSR